MKVKFMPQNIECEMAVNESVLHVAQKNSIHIKSVCKGVPSCAECRVRILDGEHHVLPPSSQELNLIGTSYFVDQRRLSCQLRCFGDIVVDLSEQVEKAEQVNKAKRPRGAAQALRPEESKAKMGNIMLEDKIAEKTSGKVVEYEADLLQAEDALFQEETRREIERLKKKNHKGPTSTNDEDE